MKVVVVNTLYPPVVVGGAEKSVSLLCEALVSAGIETAVVSLHPSSSPQEELLRGVKVYRLPIENLYWPFGNEPHSASDRFRWHVRDTWNTAAAAKVAQILDTERPQILHTNNLTGFSVALWSEANKRSIAVVHTLRDYHLMCKRSTLFRNGGICKTRCLDCTAMTFFAKRASAEIDYVIGNSEFLLDRHRASGYFADVPGTAIYNIMDDINAPPITREQQGDILTFGYIGKIDPAKGIEIVLQATGLIQHNNWRLVIAGRGPTEYVEGLKRRFQDPRIKWLGFMDVKDLFRSLDVTIVSSVWFEPLPRVIIESIACRRPMICSRSGGIPEIAEFGDLIGTYEATDSAALAALMTTAVAERRFADTYRGRDPADLTSIFGAEAVAARNISAYTCAMNALNGLR
jgi:glycosyltransferase involved in cell wall biosynthesis